MRQSLYILCALFISSSLSADSESEIPKMLFSILQDNSNWELVDSDSSGLTVSTKFLANRDLAAIMVEKKTSLPSSVISNVIMDVGNYSDFLVSAGKIFSKEISRTKSSIDGYQYLSIDAPFFSDRRYCFKMNKSGIALDDSLSLVHWYLLSQDGKHSGFLENTGRGAVYLDHGAGLWMAYKNPNGTSVISYRLYMDPGGAIPNFLIDKINKISIVNIFKDALAEAEKRNIINQNQ